jgi:hypothetical protein
MRLSREPSPVHIMTDQKQLENVEYFNYLCNLITNARCTREIIQGRIAMTKAAFTTRKSVFTSKLDINFRKKLLNREFRNNAASPVSLLPISSHVFHVDVIIGRDVASKNVPCSTNKYCSQHSMLFRKNKAFCGFLLVVKSVICFEGYWRGAPYNIL